MRFIPTCVGNTDQQNRRQGQCSVHPHMRGEYLVWLLQPESPFGSSPHAWGIHDAVAFHAPVGRFIPTCVGNTSVGSGLSSMAPVHPHMRGEYNRSAALRPSSNGSSPHAWGIPQGHLLLQLGGRFIPTCVGNTRRWAHKLRFAAVHPHMRGEYHHRRTCGPERNGSSPHAWGILDMMFTLWVDIRFIPTCVGNTW